MASRVYVIELGREAGRRRDPRIPWVYVGSSARDADTRFTQHRRGYKSSGIVKRHAVRLRPELYEDLPSFRRSTDAREAEEERARELAEAGFVAHSDGVSFGKRGGDWTEWGSERLEPVADYLDAAIAELTTCSFRPLEADPCARLLWGERGFWVSAYLDQDDPPPSYAQFAHVQLDLLVERCTTTLSGAGAAPGEGRTGEPSSSSRSAEDDREA